MKALHGHWPARLGHGRMHAYMTVYPPSVSHHALTD
jgi:hypothetical protein